MNSVLLWFFAKKSLSSFHLTQSRLNACWNMFSLNLCFYRRKKCVFKTIKRHNAFVWYFRKSHKYSISHWRSISIDALNGCCDQIAFLRIFWVYIWIVAYHFQWNPSNSSFRLKITKKCIYVYIYCVGISGNLFILFFVCFFRSNNIFFFLLWQFLPLSLSLCDLLLFFCVVIFICCCQKFQKQHHLLSVEWV